MRSGAFHPAAVPGLTIGCLLFNLSYAGALPLDVAVGSLASFLATGAMWLTRKLTVKGFPLPGLLMPALFNALLVGWELSVYIGGGFWLNAIYVAIGEAAVLLTLGAALYYAMRTRHLDSVCLADTVKDRFAFAKRSFLQKIPPCQAVAFADGAGQLRQPQAYGSVIHRQLQI